MNISNHIADHAILNTPSLNADGNLDAHVLHREDTLANLLAVVDAGEGEIAVATDVDSLVVYQGNPSVGVEFEKAGNSPVFTRFLMLDTTVSSSVVASNNTSLLLPTYSADVQICLTADIPAATNWLWIFLTVWDGVGSVTGRVEQSIVIPNGYSSSPRMQINFNDIKTAYTSGTPKFKIDFWHESGADRLIANMSIKMQATKI